MSYVEEMSYATKSIIGLIIGEESRLKELESELKKQTTLHEMHRRDFETSDLNEDFAESYVQGKFAQAAQAGQLASAIAFDAGLVRINIQLHEVAVQALCGAILQIAKQGISLIHGGYEAAPPGRMLGRSTLRDVIWQGRNQALHYEEGKFREAVLALFAVLEEDFGACYALSQDSKINMAKALIDLLGWNSYDVFAADLKSLGL